VLTFRRAVVVDQWADLRIGLEASTAAGASWGMKALVLGGTLVILAALGWIARASQPSAQAWA